MTAAANVFGRLANRSALASPAALARDGIVVFALSLALYLTMVWVVVFRLGIFVTDAMSRTVHAWQVFFSGDPKLTAIGFIWAPLPTILQLPLVLIPALRTDGLSGNLLTAVMGSITCVGVLAALTVLDVARQTRLAMTAIVALNPLILFYAANGMSEMTSTAFTIWSIAYLLRWSVGWSLLDLVLSSFSLSLACLARYDSLTQAALMVLVIPFVLGNQPTRPQERQACTLFYLTPVAAAVLLWLLANLLIMGDALHFARGAYSNAAQIGYQMVLLPRIGQLTGNPPAIAAFLVEQITVLSPAFSIGLIGTAILAWRRSSRLGLSLAALALTFPAFQALNFLAGQSAAFLRYFILAIPFGVLLVGYLQPRLPLPPRVAGIGALILLLGSNASTLYAMQQATEWGQWNDIFLRAIAGGTVDQTWAVERQIADYLAEHHRGRDILVDDFQGYRIIFFTGHPDWFIATGDGDFEVALRRPVGRARYILASKPRLEGTFNRVNVVYPTLFDQGATWATLEHDWANSDPLGSTWRLYRLKEAP